MNHEGAKNTKEEGRRKKIYSKQLELRLFYNITNRLKASGNHKSCSFSLPCRGGSGRGAGRGLQEGFHIWLNYKQFAV
jgi:hypothetical protein